MLDAVSDQLPILARDLAVGAFVGFAYLTARNATGSIGTRSVLLKGSAWCAGLALLAALLAGEGTCVGGDPLFGYCEEREGAYLPSMGARAATFVYWFGLLFVPVVAGALNDKARLRFLSRRPTNDRA